MGSVGALAAGEGAAIGADGSAGAGAGVLEASAISVAVVRGGVGGPVIVAVERDE